MSAAAQSAPETGGAKQSGFAQNRRLAAAVLAAVVLVFTPLGAWRSLKGAVGRVEDQFYTGVNGRGAVADYIADAENAALGLITTGANYEAAERETQALRDARAALADVLEENTPRLSEVRGANESMSGAFAGLKEALLSLELSEQDAANIEYYSAQFEGAEGAVSHAGYNEAAEEFTEKVYNSFPTKLIGGLFNVEPPEIFQ